MTEMNIPVRDRYQIKVVYQQSSTTDASWKEVLTTDIVGTRTAVVDIATRLQNVYPKPEHRVLVHLLAHLKQPLQVAWETPEEPGSGPE